MSAPTTSEHWYRVAQLRPRLREHVELHRHFYRGRRSYLLQDRSTGAFHRFGPAVYRIIGRLDGERTVQALWDAAVAELGDDAPTQDEVIRLLGQLQSANLLRCDVAPDALELFERYSRERRRGWKQRLMNPVSIRLPLVDPDRFLRRRVDLVRPLFGWAGLCVWLLTVLTATVLAGVHWQAITADLSERVLSPGNLAVMLLAYPFVKLLHELGHAFATRIWGGEVHDMGIVLLVFVPLPYVDATASAGFNSKYRRIVVSAAGMMVELLLAALALFVWISVEPGMVSKLAYNIMLIGSVSTLFFNGNPLLRFDGYYMLADAIEIPDLGTRSTRYLQYLALRYLYGVADAASPVETRSEALWLAGYGIASLLYRLALMCVIALFVAGKYLTVGVLLALWILFVQIVLPLVRLAGFLISSSRLQMHRGRALSVSGAAAMALAGLLFFMPVPLWTMAEGVVWLPEQSLVKAGTDCFVTEVLATTGSRVQAGQPLLRCEDPLLESEVEVLEARLGEMQARYQQERSRNTVEAESLKQDMVALQEELAVTRAQLGALTLISPAQGELIIPGEADLPGRYLRRGKTVALVRTGAAPRARVVVEQADIGLVRRSTQRVSLRMAGDPGQLRPATVDRVIPAATQRLPDRALGTAGGGRLAVDPQDEDGLQVLEPVFQVELELPDLPVEHYGERVYVRFEHGAEPLARQWQRSLRQLFMRDLGI